MFCRNCGAKIPEGGSFCGSCGTPIKEEPVAGGESQGKRPVMEGQGGEKKIDVSGEARKNNPNMGAQSKGRKPLIIGVCSGILLLAVGTAILFATGVIGGKDKPEEVIAEAEEPEKEKVADSREQQKESIEEKPVEEVKKPEQKESEQDMSLEEMANEAFEAYKAYIREKRYDEEGRYSYCLFYLDDDDYPELSIRFESGSTGDRYRLYVFQNGEVTETDFRGMNEFGMYKERSGYLYDVLFHTGTVSCNVGILKGASVEMLAEELYDCFNEDGKEVGTALEKEFRKKFGISDGEWRHTADYATLEEAFEQLGSDGAGNKDVDKKADWRQSYINAIENGEIRGYEQGYAFNDINSDGTPELFIHAGSHSDYMLYVKEDGSVDGVSAQYYNGNMLYGHIEWYNPPEGEITDIVYYYDENEDVYKPVEGKILEQKQDESENIFLIDDSEVSEQVYNTRLKEIEDMEWKYGQTSEYDAEHYGCQTEDIIRAITEYQETSQPIQGENETDGYLCSDSSSRVLTQEDIEELQSGTYPDLPEGEGIIQMAVNEMYARKGYQFGSQGIQDYFEEKEWYRDIRQRNSDQKSIYQNMSDIEKANVQFLSSFSEDSQAAQIDVEAEVAQIREWYYDTQERQDFLMYCEYEQGKYYFEGGYAIKGVIPAGYNNWGYTREYYYHDQKLYFAFLFAGNEEYRIYFKDGKVMRYVDSNGTVYDYGNIGEGEQLGKDVMSESEALYPGMNCGA